MTPCTRWSARGHVVLGLLCHVVLLGGFGGWAALTHISGAIVAPGRFEVDQNRQVVQHQTGDTVASTFTDESESVDAGEVLLRLDGVELKSRLAITESQLFELMARRSRLEAERDGAQVMTLDVELLDVAEQRRAERGELERMDIRAPASRIVYGM